MAPRMRGQRIGEGARGHGEEWRWKGARWPLREKRVAGFEVEGGFGGADGVAFGQRSGRAMGGNMRGILTAEREKEAGELGGSPEGEA